MKVSEYISNILEKDKVVHITLIDPEKQSPSEAVELARIAKSENTDIIMVGGSSRLYSNMIVETVKAIKSNIDLPIVQIIRDGSEIEASTDCVILPIVINSLDPHFCLGLAISAASSLKKLKIETIPMGYIIINPGGTAGWVTKSLPIPRNSIKVAVDCAVAAETVGFKYVYLEAGSGASEPVPSEMISSVKKSISIPLIVGGGIRDPEKAIEASRAGADIIVTGTILEESKSLRGIIDAIKKSKAILD